ncbi:hypothetical protein DC498_11030 [Terrimonas sp.]|uniref:bestrophin-like domain n=1 Tax=Terrimonas sp. TaxID=1914338 RepID=UPI000D51AB01|nr:DUF4239 domain-containing protein [Terrimonas sp.]PVD52249.1 hypothetical protein DC498_11030 [Terrimonas sp.]
MLLATFNDITNLMPSWLLCFLFVTVVILCSLLGLYIFNEWHRHTKLLPNNEVAGVMFGAISLIYSLILAFVIVAAWEAYEDLEKEIQAESDKMNNIITHISTMPDSIRQPIHEALYNYCQRVRDDEWNMQSEGVDNQSSAIPCIRLMLLTLDPKNELQRNVFKVVDEDLSQITELRRSRLSHNRSQIPGIVWQILQYGSVLLIVFSYFFHVASLKLKRIYLSFFSGCLGMCLFLVWSLDHPFHKHIQVSNKPYMEIQQILQKTNSIICN